MWDPPQTVERGWPAERLLAEHAVLNDAEIVLVTPLGAGELAQRLERQTKCDLSAFFHDCYDESKCRRQSTVTTICQPDFPDRTYDAILIPVRHDGDAELMRDYLQQAYVALREGGTLWTATNNPQDSWLRENIDKVFGSTRLVHSCDDGCVYKAVRKDELRRTRRFAAEVTFRFEDRVLKVITRPGVFAHRKIDTGVRAILKVMQIEDGEDVLEIGAGSGALSLAAAVSSPSGRVSSVDSNCRAIQCLRESAALNQLHNIEALVAHDGGGIDNQVDVCLANPPYYASFRIAELFLNIAQRALRPNGRLYLVTKFPKWYVENLHRWFEQGEIQQVGHYYVVRA